MEKTLNERVKALEAFMNEIKDAKVVVIVNGKKEAEIKNEQCDCNCKANDVLEKIKPVATTCGDYKDCEESKESKEFGKLVDKLVKANVAFKREEGTYLPVDDDKVASFKESMGLTKVRKSINGVRKYWYLF